MISMTQHKVCYFIVILMGLLLNNVNSRFFKEIGTSSKVCDSSVCKETAKAMLSSIDPKVNPCENFYQFACGGFIEKAKIPDNQPFWSVMSKLKKKVVEKIHEELKSLKNTDSNLSNAKNNDWELPDLLNNDLNLPDFMKKVRDFYTSCMNEDDIEARGLRDLVMSLKFLGTWPVMEKVKGFEFRGTEKSLETILMHMTFLGHTANMLVNLHVTIAGNNTKTWSLELSQPELALPREFLTEGRENPTVDAYGKMMVEVAVELGVDHAKAKRDMGEVLDFEISLAKITVPDVQLRELEIKYNPMTIAQLETTYSYFRWHDYLSVNPIENSPDITEEELVNVVVPSFYEKLGPLLKKTQKRVIINFLLWRVIFENKAYFNKRITDIWGKVSTVVIGVTVSNPRWQICMSVLEETVKPILGAIYVRKYFSLEDKYKASDLVKLFHKNFIDLISEQEWMDDETRNNAVEKAKHFRFFVGFPDEMLNDNVLDNYYHTLGDISQTGFSKNVARARNHRFLKKWRRLHREVDPETWEEHAEVMDVNAFYEPATNGIMITAGILQDVFYSPDRPLFLNLGSLAYIIGHEMFHSVDDHGRKYNHEGVLHDWWSTETSKEFEKRAEEMAKEYSSYEVEGANMTLDGKFVLGEAIADHGGLKLAHKIMQGWLKAHSHEPTQLPGLQKYSPSQLFWMSAALPWCSKVTPQYLQVLVLTDSHPPTHTRVNGPFRNSPNFAQDWKCPRGSYMNPRKKVNVF